MAGHVDQVHDQMVVVDPGVAERITAKLTRRQITRSHLNRSVEVARQDGGDVFGRALEFAGQLVGHRPDLSLALAEFGGLQNLPQEQGPDQQYAGDHRRGLADHGAIRPGREQCGDHQRHQRQRPGQPAGRRSGGGITGCGPVAGDERDDDQQRVGRIQKIDQAARRVARGVRLVDPQTVRQRGGHQARDKQGQRQPQTRRGPDRNQQSDRHDQDVTDRVGHRNREFQRVAGHAVPDRAHRGHPGDQEERAGDDDAVKDHLGLAPPATGGRKQQQGNTYPRRVGQIGGIGPGREGRRFGR